MQKHLPIVVPLLALVLLTLACNGDGGTPATPGATPAETPTSEPTEVPTQQPSPTDIEETAIGETPIIEPTAVTPAASPIPIGTPAIAPADLSLYEGMAIDQEECFFDPRAALANCLGRGLYSVDPPLTGEDISCSILIIEEEPVVVFCRSHEPQDAVYYAIQGAP
jgi:hypothetical protein